MIVIYGVFLCFLFKIKQSGVGALIVLAISKSKAAPKNHENKKCILIWDAFLSKSYLFKSVNLFSSLGYLLQ